VGISAFFIIRYNTMMSRSGGHHSSERANMQA